jgi:hypothetical protein
MLIIDPTSELKSFHAYARKLRTMAEEHPEPSERVRLEQMACRVENDASSFAQQFASRSTTSANV